MFNTTVLDVAIGMIFIYLLLSLLCTAANELIELALKKRAIDLERGIRELLSPGSKSGTGDVVQQLYNHPLVNSLFDGKYETSRIGNSLVRKIARTHLPSYIPARTFALALMDLIQPAKTGDSARTVSGAAGATPPAPKFELNLTVPPPRALPITDAANPLSRLITAINDHAVLPQHAKQALIPLIEAAGDDVAKARENIEGWFDASMDRVSSWYKRRSQVVILILGLIAAAVLNADSITIFRRLATDRPLRESVVTAAQEYAKAQAATVASPRPSPESKTAPPVEGGKAPKVEPTPTPTPTPLNPTPALAPTSAPTVSPTTPTPTLPPTPSIGASTPACLKDAESSACQRDMALQKIPACVRDRQSAECKREENLLNISVCAADRNSDECKRLARIPACIEDGKSEGCVYEQLCPADKKETAECRYRENLLRVRELGLPIGWTDKNDPKRNWPGWTWAGDNGGWWDQVRWHWLGWLLTALAISLGAPFWFDLLNKFIVVRSAVKPHEKSPEEGSKD